MNYTYTLNGVAVNPTGKWEIEYRRNEGQIFFRRKLTGELIFKGVDYVYINSVVDNLVSYPEGCTYIDFVIYCSGVEFWTGVFKYPYSFTFDDDSCTATGTPEVADEYSCIMTYYEREYNYTDFKTSMSGPPYAWNSIDIYNTVGGLELNLPIVWSLRNHIYLILGESEYLNCFEDTDIKSSFLWEDDFPNGDDYATYYGTNNYVTGAANWLDTIHVIDNNYIRTTAGGTGCSDAGTSIDVTMISFKMIEEWLRERFNAYWYIDQNGDFRIEHISFFLSGFAHSDYGSWIDLSTLMSGCNSYADRRNKYKYLTDKLFDQEKWEWQHFDGNEGGADHNINFKGVPIFYGPLVNTKSDCVPDEEFKEKISSTPLLSTDIEWLINLLNLAPPNPDELACGGFFMFDLYLTPTPDRIKIAVGHLDGLNAVNAHCSTANLMEYFFTWNRIFINGDMNTADVTVFDSAQKLKLQEEIEFPLCCSDDFDPMKTIITEMGEGTIHSAVQTPYSLKIQLLYD